jgi:hypothetical protein
VSGEPKRGWREVRGTVDAAKALAEYERVKAMLPPGVEPTLDDLHHVNALPARASREIPKKETLDDTKRRSSRATVLKARRDWQTGKALTPWGAVPVSRTTYYRLRRRYGLIPWPKEYREKRHSGTG